MILVTFHNGTHRLLQQIWPPSALKILIVTGVLGREQFQQRGVVFAADFEMLVQESGFAAAIAYPNVVLEARSPPS